MEEGFFEKDGNLDKIFAMGQENEAKTLAQRRDKETHYMQTEGSVDITAEELLRQHAQKRLGQCVCCPARDEQNSPFY